MATNLDLKHLDLKHLDIKKTLDRTQADLKKATEEIRKRVSDPTPLYAVAGVGDAAVEKLKEVPTKVSKFRTDMKADDKSVQAKVSEAVMSIPAEALQLTAKISTFAEGGVKKAEAQYKDLATRGEAIVRRLSHQKATQDLLNQAQATVTRARVARGAATRGAEGVKAAAGGTVSSARKTATKAPGKTAKAAPDAGPKTGDQKD